MTKFPNGAEQKMKKYSIIAAAAAIMTLLFCGAALAAKFVPAEPIMPLSDVKPGMTGYAKTVISGTDISTFKVKIIGILPRKTSPQNLIVIEVEDKQVRENGGIASGMSGSPVYIDGKLIGAIGYGWSFADNNLGMVTPIEEMVMAMDQPDKIPWFDIPVPAPEEPISKDIQQTPVSGDKTAQQIDKRDGKDKPVSGDQNEDVEIVSGDRLEKKMMPLMVDGISDRMSKRLGEKLGVEVVPLGSSMRQDKPVNLKWQPKPGAAIGAALAWGDFSAGGIGTLTALSKDGRFIAFAHPMFNRGSVSYALTEAGIVKIIPSLTSSFKLGYMGKITGIVTQDRPEAIGGVLGRLAAASSYTVNFKDIDAGKSETKRFQTIADPYTGPELGTTGILGLIDAMWAQKGSGTALMTYTVSGGNMEPAWTRRDIFYSEKDVVKAMQKDIEKMGKVISLNPFRTISPYGVTVNVELTKKPRVVYVDKISVQNEKDMYKPGEKILVDVTLRPWRERPVVKTFELTVPKDAMAFCEITARGGGLEEPVQEPLLTGVRTITSFKELISELNAQETNNQLIVEISGPEKADDKKSKTSNDKDKENLSGAKELEGEGGKEKASEPKRGGTSEKKDTKQSFSPADLLEDRFVSEIKAERIKQGAMVVADTNSYIEGVLRMFIKVQSPLSDGVITQEELAEMLGTQALKQAGEDEETENDQSAEGDEDNDGDDDENEDSFAILKVSGRI